MDRNIIGLVFLKGVIRGILRSLPMVTFILWVVFAMGIIAGGGAAIEGEKIDDKLSALEKVPSEVQENIVSDGSGVNERVALGIIMPPIWIIIELTQWFIILGHEFPILAQIIAPIAEPLTYLWMAFVFFGEVFRIL